MSRGARKRGRPRRAPKWRGRRRILFVSLLLVGGSATALWVTLPDVSQLVRHNPRSTAFIDLRREQSVARGRRWHLRWHWRRWSAISTYLKHAVVHAEDAHFFRHEGVDWDAMKQAARRNWEDKRLGVGASTITQQLAKNLYLSPSRNPLRKLRELLIARRLERHLSKRRILELYLNVAEWGSGIFGAEAAARHWFRSSAATLTPAHAARLAVALPNPLRRSPRVRSRTLSRRAARLIRAMRRHGLIDANQTDAALAQLSH